MAVPIRLLTVLTLLLAQGCVSDDERCDDGQRYENGGCVEILGDGGGADALGSDTAQQDAEIGDAPALPSGMGDVCSGPTDCAGKEADYCLIQPPSTSGVCTIQDCNATANDCPGGYSCCDFSVTSVPNFCAADDDYATLKSMAMCL